MASGGQHLSKEFFELVKSIGESRSKQEEDKIIVAEVQTLKQRMAARDVTNKKMREYIMRMVYVEMLGHDASFGHIHAVKMAHSRSILDKRMGYLGVTLTLHSEHEFMLLLINTIQTDLKSENYLEVSMALTVVCKLTSQETVPALLPLVVKLMDHKEGLVKKKAIMAIEKFYLLDPQSTTSLNSGIRKALCDSNISVMAASLHILFDLSLEKPQAYKDLVPDFVSILKQVIEHRLPRDYDYHRMPAPWIQLKLLQILGVLGAADKSASEGMYEVLHEVMKRADIGINVGYAIVYECVRTITMIYPDTALIEDAALSISRFITAENHNLKYLGVKALAAIVQIDPKYAAEHQLVVIDCLEDPDETLKRKTLDLLYSMTNPQNVTVVVDKLIGYLKAATDQYMKTDLLSRISQLAEKYAPSNDWYILTMNTVMELAGELVQPSMAHSLLKLIIDNAAGAAGDDDLREYSVDTYLHLLLTRKNIPDLLLQVSAWVIGEYGHTSSEHDPTSLLHTLKEAMDRSMSDQALTKGWILSAMLKLVALLPACPDEITEIVLKAQNSLFLDLQQKAHEFTELTKNPSLLKQVMIPDQASEDIQVDESLSFLNGYVDAALQAGAKPYQARSTFGTGKHGDGALKYQAYAQPSIPSGRPAPPSANNDFRSSAHVTPPPSNQAAPYNPYAHSDPNADKFFGQTNGAGAPAGGAGGFGAPPAGSFGAPSNPYGDNSAGGGLQLQGVTKRKWGPQGYNDEAARAAKAAEEAAAAEKARHAEMAARAPSNPYGAPPPNQSPYGQHGGGGGFGGAPDYAPQHAPEPQAPSAPRAPRAPAPSEKEKMATQLFAGGANPPAPQGRPGAPRPPPKRVQPPAGAPQAKPPAAAAPAPTGAPTPAPAPKAAAPDILGGFFDTPAPAPATPPVPKPSDNLEDLFGGLTTAPAPQPQAQQQQPQAPRAPQPRGPQGAPQQPRPPQQNQQFAAPMSAPQHPPQQPQAANNNLMDLFGAPSAPAPQQQAQQQRPAPAGGLADLFGSPAPAPAPSSASPFDVFGGGSNEALGYAAASPQVKSQLESLPKHSANDTVIASNAQLQISFLKLFAPDSIKVALFVSNKGATPISNVQMTITLPNGLSVTFAGDQTQTRAGQHPGSQVITIPVIPPKGTQSVIVSAIVREFSFLQSTMGVSGQIGFAGIQAPLGFNIGLEVTDLLRPAPMNTAQYGQYWKQYTDEAKAVVKPTAVTAPQEFMNRITNIMRLHPVQTIGVENIVSGRLVAPPTAMGAQNLLLFVHGKVAAGQVELTVRSKSVPLSQAILKQLQQTMR